MDTSTQYDFWHRRLAGEVLPIHDGDPQSGFYRWRENGGNGWVPVAYWYSKDGYLKCLAGTIDGGRMLDDERARAGWTYASKNPISREMYNSVARHGQPWPDQSEAVTVLTNNPPDEGSVEAIDEAIRNLADEVERLPNPIITQDQADQVADLKNMLGTLEQKADAARVAEKAPHLQASRDVDAKWQAPIARASLAKKVAAMLLGPWLKRKADEAAAARAAAVQQGKDPEVVAQPKTTAGTRGRSVGLRETKKAKINDFQACLAHFAAHPEVAELVQKLADRAAKTGVPAPGTEIVTIQQAA